MKYLIYILILLAGYLCSCEMPIHEFPYQDYLGQWRDSLTVTEFQFNQSEMTIRVDKNVTTYRFWKVSNDSLLLSNEPVKPAVIFFIVEKKPYLSPKYEWKMVLNNGTKYYLKKT